MNLTFVLLSAHQNQVHGMPRPWDIPRWSQKASSPPPSSTPRIWCECLIRLDWPRGVIQRCLEDGLSGVATSQTPEWAELCKAEDRRPRFAGATWPLPVPTTRTSRSPGPPRSSPEEAHRGCFMVHPLFPKLSSPGHTRNHTKVLCRLPSGRSRGTEARRAPAGSFGAAGSMGQKIDHDG